MDCELLIEAEKDWIKSVLEQYRVSYNRGFIPDEDPLVIIFNYLINNNLLYLFIELPESNHYKALSLFYKYFLSLFIKTLPFQYE